MNKENAMSEYQILLQLISLYYLQGKDLGIEMRGGIHEAPMGIINWTEFTIPLDDNVSIVATFNSDVEFEPNDELVLFHRRESDYDDLEAITKENFLSLLTNN